MAAEKYKIVLIGAGNVATHLGKALKKAEHPILQVVSLHSSSAEQLAKILKCKAETSSENIDSSADIYIIAVNDDAISTVAKQLKLKNKIIIHTSGSADINLLRKASDNYGVLYPVQTFSKKTETDFTLIPILLEASNEKTYNTLAVLANSLVIHPVTKVNSKQRKTVHLAAVFANNFSNHLYLIASDILNKDNFNLDVLLPLISETFLKIVDDEPRDMQTGPAIRGDKKTMEAHIKLLSNNKDYQNIYKLLSKSIVKSTKTKK